MKKMKAILETWNKMEEEVQGSSEVEADVAQAAQELKGDLAPILAKLQAQIKQKQGGQELEESLGLLGVAGMAALIPAILKIISFTIKKISRNDKNQVAHYLEHGAHKIEGMFKTPLMPLAKMMVLASGVLDKIPEAEKPKALEEKTEKVAEILLMVAIGMLGAHAGLGAVEAFKHSHFGIGTYETLATAIKSGEVGVFLRSALTPILQAGAEAGAAARSVATAGVAAAGAIKSAPASLEEQEVLSIIPQDALEKAKAARVPRGGSSQKPMTDKERRQREEVARVLKGLISGDYKAVFDVNQEPTLSDKVKSALEKALKLLTGE
jgi:hypothetical protein